MKQTRIAYTKQSLNSIKKISSYLILPIAKGRIHSLDARSNFHRSFSVVLVAVHPPNTYRHFS